jgi:hypothetical protein
MREITGTKVRLSNNEIGVVFIDYMNNTRELIAGITEKLDLTTLPIKDNTSIVISI